MIIKGDLFSFLHVGDLGAAIVDLARKTKKVELKKSSPGPKIGTSPLLRFLKAMKIPDGYIKNVRRTGSGKKGYKSLSASSSGQTKKNLSPESYFQGYDNKL